MDDGEQHIRISKGLLPLSWLYGLAVRARNLLFDIGILKSKNYDVPMISVGNITVGGTGKTPHVEYLIRLLKDRLNVAVLSRGYKRKSRGFVLADKGSTAADIGDEPYQIKNKYAGITVAVDKNRRRAMDILTDDNVMKDIDVVILDDAFQHRYVKPGINILLVDYHRQIMHDKLLPAGRLREPLSGKSRADVVIVTKCPDDLKPMDYRVITKAMDLYPYQSLFFTTLEYGMMYLLFAGGEQKALADLKGMNVLLLTGIASPWQMRSRVEACAERVVALSFSDHHTFKKKDVRKINAAFTDMPAPKIIVTTEKDAARLKSVEGLDDDARAALFVLPVSVRFMLGQGERFDEKIIGYVQKNSRNSILAKAKDDDKSANSHHTGNRPRTISFRDN